MTTPVQGLENSASADTVPVPAQPGARAFVWLVFAGMAIAALGLVHRFGHNFPFCDDWGHISALTGERPIWPWLWQQHNEHRIPLPKLVLLGLGRLTNFDFRAAMYFNVAALAVVAALMIWAAGRARGSTSYSDAFFPIVVLSWGNLDNLLWHFQVGFVLPAVLSAGLLVLLVTKRRSWSMGTALLGGILLVLLPLTGAPGLIMMAALTPWLGWEVVSRWRAAEPCERRGLLALGSSLVTALLVAALYFHHYVRPPWHPLPPSRIAFLGTSLEVLSLSFGSAGYFLWPYSAAIAVSLFLFPGVVLAITWRQRRAERHRVLGMLCFLGGIVSLAVAVGWGRAFLGPGGGASPRYFTLVAPGVCCGYFVCLLYGGSALRQCGQMVLFLLATLMLPLNVSHAFQFESGRDREISAVERDLERGVPCLLLAKRIKVFDPLTSEETLMEGLRCLCRAGARGFRSLKEDSPVRKVPIPLASTQIAPESRWTPLDRTPTSMRLLAFPAPQRLYAVDLTYVSEKADLTAGPLHVFFRLSSHKGSSTEDRSYPFFPNLTAGEQTVRIPVYDTVDEIWIDSCDRKKNITISKVEMVLEKGAAASAALPVPRTKTLSRQ